MARAFIVRPFGVQAAIDFDAVERLLIQPAFAKAGISATSARTWSVCW
jgi:hypothetical protein